MIQPTEHAPWCLDYIDPQPFSDGPEGCYSGTEVATVRSSVKRLSIDGGEPAWAEIRMFVARELGAYRSPLLPADETHVISIGLGAEQSDAEPFVAFTIPEAADMRDKLTRLLEMAQTDAAEGAAG